MSTDQKNTGLRYYIIKSSVGLVIMKVAIADIEKFLTVYSDQVLAEGITLADALVQTDWASVAPQVDDDFIPGKIR